MPAIFIRWPHSAFSLDFCKFYSLAIGIYFLNEIISKSSRSTNLQMQIFSLSGATSTIFAYLGELHSNAAKDRAIMISTVIYCGAAILDPIQAYLVINGDWQLYVPFIGTSYKQWQLLLICCGLPSLLSAIVLLFFPESPRFVLNQGDAKQAFEIIQQMNRWNNGKSAKLSFDAIEDDPESEINRERFSDGRSKGLLLTVWDQTVPLFKPPYLGSTLLICTIMMLINATGIG